MAGGPGGDGVDGGDAAVLLYEQRILVPQPLDHRPLLAVGGEKGLAGVRNGVDDPVAEGVLLRGEPGGDAVDDDALPIVVLECQRSPEVCHSQDSFLVSRGNR